MMERENLAERILRNLDIAVLERVQPGKYVVHGTPPAFYDDVFPPTGDGHCTEPWQYSAMLEFFFQSAEEFFSTGRTGTISSGMWEEEGLVEADQALSAEAMAFEDARLVTLHLLRDTYTERVGVMRKAREELLERRLLRNDLEKYREKSRRDGLTKLFNRATFMEILSSRMEESAASSAPLALIMLDIDHFKRINDEHGHQIGDMVLSMMGSLLLSRLRRDDVVARYGGEEFIVLIPGVPPQQVLRIAEKLRAGIEAHAFGMLPSITASLGCSILQPGDSPEEFIRRADMAMYAAKESGRNAVRMRSPDKTELVAPGKK
jgi:diguanylate cyclase (GGDEF)-like protein